MTKEKTKENEQVLKQIASAIESLRFGSIEITLHDGRVTQIEKREKVRLSDTPPHELSIHQNEKSASFQATINHIYAVGPIVRVELEQKNKGIIEAELTKEEFKLLDLTSGQSVYLTAKNVQIFPSHH